jgi:hypothetical protein
MLWQLLIPAFDRFVPNHVISDFLALSLHPLFRRPRGRNGNRQQEDRAEDGDRNALRRRPRRIDVGSATRTCIVCDRCTPAHLRYRRGWHEDTRRSGMRAYQEARFRGYAFRAIRRAPRGNRVWALGPRRG